MGPDRDKNTRGSRSQDLQVFVTYSGRHQIRYHCPFCDELLRSALKDAGNKEYCPRCSRYLIVPGSEKFLELKDEIDLPRVSRLNAIKLKNSSEMEQIEHQLIKELEQANVEKKVRLKQLNRKLESQFADAIRDKQLSKKEWQVELLLKLSAICARKINHICESNMPEHIQIE